jgi:hypothetical protein
MTPADFDREIRAALAAGPPPEQLARLEQFWREQSRADRQRRRRARAMALVATVLAAATAWFALSRSQPPAAQHNVVAQMPRQVETSPPPAGAAAAVPGNAEAPAALPPAARTASAYERLVFAARTTAPVDPEQTLLARLRRAGDFDEARGIILRLRDVGTPASIPALLKMANQGAARPDALAAVEQILGVDRLADVVRQASSPAVRAGLMARLLAANSAQALSGFLALVADPASRSEALTAVLAAKQLPLDRFVQALDAPLKSDRMAAAIVLGRVNTPAVSEALIARVSQPGRASVETWVALLACRSEKADQFLVQAVCRPQTLGQVNNARAYWARMTP